jgi:signal transduction histidine kinase
MFEAGRLPFRVAAIARVIVLIALTGPVLWTRDAAALMALLVIGAIWALATIVDLRQVLPVSVLTTGEALLVGAVCGIVVDASVAVIGALCVPPFTASVFRGLWGMATSLCAELAMLVLFAFIIGGELTPEQGSAAFSWSVTGLGLGLIGTFLHSALVERSDPLAPYHYAQSLLRQLIDISEGLDSGLDPVALGGSILSAVRDEVPTQAMTLYVARGDSLLPLVTKSIGTPDGVREFEDLAGQCWRAAAPVRHDHVFAFPLVADSGLTGVVVAAIPESAGVRAVGLDDAVRRLIDSLRPSAVHLDTALLFAAFRDAASAEERRRLAREMHDGVAQDIASLGYLADALAAVATTQAQHERIALLRERVSAIVAEIRRSLVNLRTSIGESESLGAAIATIARNLSEVSGVPIHVTADELTDRLRPEVEAELFRIAQEAMNNAVKHAQADSIDVHCQVRAPAARITVTDDGRGLQPGRTDSHGLKIMRERALLVNGVLELSDAPGGGLCVSVTIRSDGGPEEITVVQPDFDDGTRVNA